MRWNTILTVNPKRGEIDGRRENQSQEEKVAKTS